MTTDVGSPSMIPLCTIPDLRLLSYCRFVLFSGQLQHKLNRIATASGSANASVAMSALLDVMADAHTKSAGRQQSQEPEQVGWLVGWVSIKHDKVRYMIQGALVVHFPYRRVLWNLYRSMDCRNYPFGNVAGFDLSIMQRSLCAFSDRVLCKTQQVSGRGKRSLETKLLKVYVKLLARLLRDSEKDNFGTNGINDQGSNE